MAKRDKDCITLGSGKLFIQEYTETMPTADSFTDDHLLGYIKGGATLEYTNEWYTATDDLGVVSKTVVTTETATLKSGLMTFNGQTLAKLLSTARVSEAGGKRTVKIGGVANHNGKSYALCFKHTDKVDGNVTILMRAVNQGGLSLAYAKDSETVIDAEFTALPLDNEGTLIEYIEEIGDPS